MKARRFYRAELDALRFVAFLSVFLFHTFPLAIPEPRSWMYPFFQAGRFGMCLFYCLSAYLITELLRDERALTGSIHLPWFYVRRVLRIWPLYFVVLALGYGLGAVHDSLRVSAGALENGAPDRDGDAHRVPGCGLGSSRLCTSLEQWKHPSIWRETLTYEAGGAGALCLLLGVLGVDGRGVPRSFAYLGKISYGLYAFHSFFISATHLGPVRTLESRLPQSVAAPLLHCVLPFFLTVAAAAASYRLLETPFLKLKERFAFVKSRPV